MKKIEKTCYEAVIANLVKRNEVRHELFNAFLERGHNTKDALNWISYANMALFIAKFKAHPYKKRDFFLALVEFRRNPSNLTLKNDAIQKAITIGYNDFDPDNLPASLMVSNNKIIKYNLNQREHNVVKELESVGSGSSFCYESKKENSIKHKIVNYVQSQAIKANVHGLPDYLLVTSGHQQTGPRAAMAIYKYIQTNGKLPEGIIISGENDAQGITQFSDEFVIRKKNEFTMYYNELALLGIPKEYLDKCRVISAEGGENASENAHLVIDTLNKLGVTEANLYMISYPLYQLRLATDTAFIFEKREDALDVKLWIASIAAPRRSAFGSFDYDEGFSYNEIEQEFFGLSLGNCIAHLYREHDVARFKIPYLEPLSDEVKNLIPLGLEYSYPNVAEELCGTNPTVALALLMMRSLMIKDHYPAIRGSVQDKQQQDYVRHIKSALIEQGLTTEELVEKSHNMSEEEFLKAVLNK